MDPPLQFEEIHGIMWIQCHYASDSFSSSSSEEEEDREWGDVESLFFLNLLRQVVLEMEENDDDELEDDVAEEHLDAFDLIELYNGGEGGYEQVSDDDDEDGDEQVSDEAHSDFRFNSSSSSSSSSSSWRSSHHSVSEKFQGPVFLKQVYEKSVSKSTVYDHGGVLFMRSRFPRGRFEINRAYIDSWWRHWRSFLPAADNVVLGLIGANVAVFMLWRIADPTFMMKHFMVSVDNFTSGRVHTLITCAFSHMQFEHLFSNMIGLYFFGTTIGQMFGPKFVLKLYLAGAVGGSILYLINHAFMASSSSKGSGMWYMDPLKISGLGASGALNAIMLLRIFLFPKAIHYVNFFIQVPAMLLGAFLIGKDVLRMKQGDSHISGSAHLGGAVIAALAWARIRKDRI